MGREITRREFCRFIFDSWNTEIPSKLIYPLYPVSFYLGQLEIMCPPLVILQLFSQGVNFGSYSLNNCLFPPS